MRKLRLADSRPAGRKYKNIMTKDDAIEQLRKLQESKNLEVSHQEADDILCALLSALGLSDVVDEYEKLEKWYT